jgi:hypothetical protein
MSNQPLIRKKAEIMHAPCPCFSNFNPGNKRQRKMCIRVVISTAANNFKESTTNGQTTWAFEKVLPYGRRFNMGRLLLT